MSLILSIDQSTTSTKAMLFTEQGICVDRASKEHRQIYPQPGWVEHDPEEIWQNVLSVVASLLQSNPDAEADLKAISIANQRETVVVFDKHTGKPLHNAIVWQCRRSEALCHEHNAAGNNDLVQPRTGLAIDPYFSASKVEWLLRNKPNIKAAIDNGDALIGTMDAYLVYRMTEGKVFATDPTNASRTLFYNIVNLAWDRLLCELFQVPIDALPEVRSSDSSFGETQLDGLFKTPQVICGVLGDSQAAFFAHRCFELGDAKVTFGTGSSVMLNIGDEPQYSKNGLVTSLAWVWEGKPTYAYEGIIINSAATLNWLKDQLGIFESVEALVEAAEQVESSEGVYLVPAFSGLGLPLWESAARAAIVGLSAYSDKRHIARAALDSISFQLKDAIDAMQQESGISVGAIHADGGPTQNLNLMQFTADMTGLDILVRKTTDCSALGAAMMGFLGLGVYASLQALQQAKAEETRYAVKMNESQQKSLYQGWVSALDQVLAGVKNSNHN